MIRTLINTIRPPEPEPRPYDVFDAIEDVRANPIVWVAHLRFFEDGAYGLTICADETSAPWAYENLRAIIARTGAEIDSWEADRYTDTFTIKTTAMPNRLRA